MNFAIRYLTEYRYERADHGQPERAAGQAGDAGDPERRGLRVRVDPETRLNQHLDYFGTTVIEFGISRPHEHLSIDVRARVRDRLARGAGGDGLERGRGPRLRRRGGRVPAARRSEPDDVAIDELSARPAPTRR